MTKTHHPDRTSTELGRRHFAARRTDVEGPILVDIVVEQTTNTVTGQVYAPTYRVWIDGEPSFGGFADHLPESGVPEIRFLTGVIELTDLPEFAEEQQSLQLAAQGQEIANQLWAAQVALDAAGKVRPEANELARQLRRFRLSAEVIHELPFPQIHRA